MVAEGPGVVSEPIEQVDHQSTATVDADGRALHHITDIHGQRMRAFPPPLPEATGGPREAPHVVEPFVGARGKNPAVEVSRVENRDCAGPAE